MTIPTTEVSEIKGVGVDTLGRFVRLDFVDVAGRPLAIEVPASKATMLMQLVMSAAGTCEQIAQNDRTAAPYLPFYRWEVGTGRIGSHKIVSITLDLVTGSRIKFVVDHDVAPSLHKLMGEAIKRWQ